MTTKNGWMIYGANGYAGRLVAEEALALGERPILAGRFATKVQRVAEELGLPWVAPGAGAHAAATVLGAAFVDSLPNVRVTLSDARKRSAA